MIGSVGGHSFDFGFEGVSSNWKMRELNRNQVWVFLLEDEKLSGHEKTALEHGRLSLKWLPR
tara:strand:- start:451 stop:636 length:186 start_codon:yes stop_codon:yes gene_type:complete